jgi:hypothetical protein
MRERMGLCAAAFAMIMAVGLCPPLRAQQETRRATGDQQSTGAGNEMIRGVVAAVTAEGEVFFNHQTNSLVRTEATFLTIVGSPMHSAARTNENRTNASENDKQGQTNRKRHNVYIVWLSPKTKICETADGSAKSDGNKKECSLAQLEVGDHVEAQFTPHEDSAAHNNVHLSQQMREKHGRHRTHVGFATEITILPGSDHDRSNARSGAKSNEDSK